jgi:hypothetical protein
MVLIAHAHLQQRERGRDIERIHIAALARASRPREDAPLPALLPWLRARLAARAASRPTRARPTTPTAEPVDGA